MRKRIPTILLLMFIAVFPACGDSSNEEFVPEEPVSVQDSIPTLEGDFIFLGEAAVLKGRSFIYGVKMDSISKELAQKVEPLKKTSFDMVPVVVKAKILKNPGKEGWDELIEIREVLEIQAPPLDTAENPSE